MSSLECEQGPIGVLYVVATPLGNLGDITTRAVEVLKRVDLVVAEDTRRTRKLLTRFNISTPLQSYHGDSSRHKARNIVEQLQAGKQVALLSDSGTPAVSDPGAELICLALDSGIKVVPVPGPSAVTAAFSVAGISAGAFVFAGYAPRKVAEKQQFLQQMADELRPTIFFEAPQRVTATLQMLAAICPERRIVVARELTKLHEELRIGTVAEMAEYFSEQEPRGEFTLVLSPAEGPRDEVKASKANLQEAVEAMLTAGMSRRDAARVVELLTGLSRNEAYDAVQAAHGPQ